MMVPPELSTARLHLRRWRPEDARALLPVLEANTAHFADWIPAAVSTPAPVEELETRLRGYGAQFESNEAWRYAIFRDTRLVGEASMFPRSANRRVPYAEADRVEIGYWLSGDATGRGYATEAAGALVDLAFTLPHAGSIEIRCDPRNQASAAIPRRLGFTLTNPAIAPAGEDVEASDLSVWMLRTEAGARP